ncbi:MAG: hypothetical protein K9I29_04390 [Bacteroidales bacterium]|nr:hypothetical protein [Bacteroidales bacterium]MCF8327512.1 hypothetical protein [Bacteroidales bacterium]
MKKKKITILLVLVFAGGIILSSCNNQKRCPGVYGQTDNQKTEQVS